MSRQAAFPAQAVLLTAAAFGLSACGSTSTFDWDLRPSSRFSTSEAAQNATGARPAADPRGVISYPGYQVVVAQRGDRVGDIASRLGIDARELARHNALNPDTALRGGELLVLPGRVAEPVGTSAITATPLGAPVSAAEPPRHTVARGESAFTIARLYNVTPRSLAEWNGLPADMSVREGQILVIPLAEVAAAPVGAPLNAAGVTAPVATAATATTLAATSAPGQGSATPVPPSATQPLPTTTAPAVSATPPTPPVADMAAQRTTGPRLTMPVQGRVIRAYAQGRNDGIGIGAPEGTEVRAAAAGTVAAITQDTDQVPILVIRHDNNLLTVYANIDGITVARGDRVTSGQSIARVRRGEPTFLHFEVREGFDSVDPMPYLQ